MKKIGGILLIILFSLIIVSAQNETLTIEEKARDCLENKLGDDCGGSDNTEQLAFSLLAMASESGIKSDCKKALIDEGNDDKCWPSNSCKIKETSLAILALDSIGKNTEDAEDWILSRKKTPKDLEYYLEIDASEETQCSVNTKSITINEDKTISGSPGTCLSLAYNDYWLKIKDSCLNNNFTISCDEDFISTILYRKSDSNIWHVSSDVQSASANGETEHQVSSYCFSTTSTCDYESNLWAALALEKTGHDVDDFLPYLITFEEDNDKYFPSSFLYYLTNSDGYLQEITSLQDNEGFWKVNTNEYYDTALGLLAFSGEEILAKDWLEENQGKEGCWHNNNIRDTSFILWAGWPPDVANGGNGGVTYCVDFNYYCVSQGECDEAGGNVLSSYYCSGLSVCCDTPAIEKTCAQKNGEECSAGYECSTTVVSAFDTDECCLGTCIPEETECESYNYNCRLECWDNEVQAEYECDTGDICCKTKEKRSLWWIWLLVILIILIALGILFRDKLRLWIFKFKGRFKKGPVTKTRPRFPPSAPGLRRMMPRMPRSPTRPAIRRAVSKTDKELEETLKKLKEMSK